MVVSGEGNSQNRCFVTEHTNPPQTTTSQQYTINGSSSPRPHPESYGLPPPLINTAFAKESKTSRWDHPDSLEECCNSSAGANLTSPPQQPELTNRWRHLLTDRGISGDSATPVEKGTATQEPGQSGRRRGQNATSLSDSPDGIPHWGLGLFEQDQAHNRHRLEHQHEEK